MRIYCINNKTIAGAFNRLVALTAIEEGKEYEGYQTDTKGPDGSIRTGWCIPSISENECYNINRFVRLPDSTADDMQKESREAIINLETALA